MAKVLLKVGVYRFLMTSKTAAMEVVNALIDAKVLQYEDHDERGNPVYSLLPPPPCEIEAAPNLVALPARKSEPPAPPPPPPKVDTKPVRTSAEDLWHKPRSSGNLVPHSSGQKDNSPRDERPPQEVQLRPVSRRAASAQFRLLADSIAVPPPGVICLEDRKPEPAQSQLFLDEEISRRARL